MPQLDPEHQLGEGSRSKDSEVQAMNRDYKNARKEWVEGHQ